MERVVVLLIALFVGGSSFAAEPPELTKLKASFETAKTEELESLTQKYRAALENLREQLAKDGNLAGALTVRAELDGDNEDASSAPKQMRELKSAYTKARDAKTAALEKKYIGALKAVQKKLDGRGDKAGALSVAIEIEKLLPPPPKKADPEKPAVAENAKEKLPRTREEFAKYIVGTVWAFTHHEDDSRAFTFADEENFVASHRTVKYEVTGLRKVTMTWGKTKVKCEVSPDYQTMVEHTGSKNKLRRVIPKEGAGE